MDVYDSCPERMAPGPSAIDTGDDEVKLPLIVFPRKAASRAARAAALHTCVARHLPRAGVILFRGFSLRGPREFAALVAAVSGLPTRPDEPANQAVNHQRIPNGESSSDGGWLRASRVGRDVVQPDRWFYRKLPQRVWLYCASARADVVVADMREVCARLPNELRERWTRNGLSIARSYAASGNDSWQRAFESSDRSVVEGWCDAQGFRPEWQPTGRLRLHKICGPVAQHPDTGDRAWLNAAQAFQRPTSQNGRGSSLQRMEVLAGNGEPLPETDLRAIHGEVEAAQVVVPCEQGDILLLDNRLMAHAVQSARSGDAAVYVLHGHAKSVEVPGHEPVASPARR